MGEMLLAASYTCVGGGEVCLQKGWDAAQVQSSKVALQARRIGEEGPEGLGLGIDVCLVIGQI